MPDETRLERMGSYPDVGVAGGRQADALNSLIAAVRELRDAPRDGTVDINALHQRLYAALDAVDKAAR